MRAGWIALGGQAMIKFRPVKKEPTRSVWTEEQNREFAQKWNEGMTGNDLAAHFGVSVPSVGKKRLRLNLPKRDQAVAARSRWRNHVKAAPIDGTRPTPPYVPNQVRHPFPMKPVALLERTGCAFAVDRVKGAWHFCNCALATASDYCDTHKSQMYQPRFK
jgi:hypothetical protein